MRSAWVADPDSGLSNPLSAGQVAMVDAQLGGVADGILAAIQQEAPGAGAPWRWDVLAGTGTGFTLTKAPITSSLAVYRNGLLEIGWSLSGTTLTLASTRTSGDADLRAHYQYIEPT